MRRHHPVAPSVAPSVALVVLALLAAAAPAAAAFTQINWGTVASAPVARSEGQGIAVDGKLYVFGGFQSSPFGPTNSALAYDPATNTWATLATMPTRLTHAGVAAIGRNIYVAGGYFGSSGTNFGAQTFATTAVWKYDIDANAWSAMPNLPQARGSGALVALGNVLHFFGGADISRNDKGEHYTLTIGAASWSTAVALPNPRSHLGFAALAGRIYAVDGQHDVDDNLVTQSTVHVWDPNNPSVWTQVASLLPARSHVSSATFAMGGRVLVAGGEVTHGSSIRNVSAYDPLTDTWSELTQLPAARYSGVADAIGGFIYYAGGSGNSTTYRGVPVGYTAQPDIALTPARLIFNDVQGGAATASKSIVISNPGDAALTVTLLTLGGPDATQFQIISAPTLPAVIPAGGTASVAIAFAAATTGPKGAQLSVQSDDPQTPLLSATLRGLGTLGLGGSNEPSLQWILDTWQIPVTVGDPDPTNNALPTSPLLGEEVSLQRFSKAAAGNVTIEPLAVFGPQGGSGLVARAGYHPTGNGAAKTELFTVPNAAYQSLQPATTGTLAFDPGSTVFGVYSIWPFFANREVFGEDALNTFSGAVPHHVRVYPYREPDGSPVANAYVVATEEHISGFDYQDLVFVMRNVAPGGCATAADCSGSLPTCGAFACNAGTCSVVPGNSGAVCRASATVCDAEETCSGASTTCPTDAFAVAGTPCRASSGAACDVAEACSGASPACPADAFAAAGTPCRASSGSVCDVAETCTGASPACPADGFAAAGTACRASAGACDPAEVCSGASPACAANLFATAGTPCRAGAGECDVAETCSGSSATCPADANAPAGTPCTDDGNGCTDDTCSGAGACDHPANLAPCSDSDACTTPDQCTGGLCVAGADLGNQSCSTGQPGACSAGTTSCTAGTVTCVPSVAAQAEVCGNGIDEDCDGMLDDADVCPLFCTAANTISATTQTARTKATLKEQADADKLLAKGSFILPSAAPLLDPQQPVTIAVSDGAGAWFTASVPGAAFSASGAKTSFKDKFAPYENGGVQLMQLAVGGDGRTVKFKVKARSLNLPTPQAGSGSVIIKLGERCFVDPDDSCTLAASGLSCR